ncbi:hypothetical protein SELMODRAFT_89750 [Selaginella moellendorffii]|uniref:Ribosomal protein/NADH dehydrogenase domain-containing protein n=1 Tax=Selaginella moellendorffii TaxID=88036 RepID=D8RAW6_SELML|nr:NADH dehydrogenase [ubiquinone] 1 alpha subcomplex subunit 2 [Selaginella moellendorffii]XP_002970366.1 NADH dehydrogenase [ubiquinone] 1 alpha subcomplex subunit 2 [Selaginella moellendorffii]EFJ28496.1 hypothetical protein SELMODRAFT_93947 [Selaginella moellendorffii]EFJ30384.1 hypothetical protein SELMODRAFT_89750 [Selaginella moellendorffii]|eukprot:XP_002968130.1 NADH dehydrogenase [ubiquinone] 1 alpha subcomplex subunit 2 [Selaginella moellendorffii]
MAWRSEISRRARELRILFCQTSPGSETTRDYILKNYKQLKTLNPTLPILLRECSGIQPRLWIRYPYGVEQSATLDGLSVEQIDAKLEELVKDAPE